MISVIGLAHPGLAVRACDGQRALEEVVFHHCTWRLMHLRPYMCLWLWFDWGEGFVHWWTATHVLNKGQLRGKALEKLNYSTFWPMHLFWIFIFHHYLYNQSFITMLTRRNTIKHLFHVHLFVFFIVHFFLPFSFCQLLGFCFVPKSSSKLYI